MKKNVTFILVFLSWILVNPINLFSQTIIYQTGFENIKDSAMLGKSLANDGWLVNDSSIQKTAASIPFGSLRPLDEFRNAWTVSDADHSNVCGGDPTCMSALKPIQGKTLAMSAYWGVKGTVFYESELIGGLVSQIVDGFPNYYTDLATDRWAYRLIPSTGYLNITLSFQWRCNGLVNTDYGQVGYSTDGGTTWTWITTGGTVNGQYYGQQTNVQSATVNLPAACNNQSNLAIGFRFKCAGNGANQDLNTRYPGFMVDNVVVTGISGTSCNAVAIQTQPVNTSACSNSSANFTVTTTGDAPISYQWQVGPVWNNISDGGTEPTYSGTTTATLTVTNPQTDGLSYRCIASNCFPVSYFTSNAVTLTVNSFSIPKITSKGNLTYCGGGSDTITASAGASSYLWSNGGTTQSITVTTPGLYTVIITDNNGCYGQSLPYMVGSSPVANPDICIVTVDNITGKNEVVWNRPVSKAIKHFNVYSQGNQANVFNLIGKVPWDSLTVFIDTASIPAQQSYLYQLSAVDTCGSESQLSAVHQTIHLSINQGIGSTWNLIWNNYIGFTFASYNIYRGTSPSNMTLLNTVASTLNSYTDLNPPAGYVYYQIEALNPNPCKPTKAKDNKYSSTKSNIATNNLTNSVANYNKENAGINIYPNPANDIVTIDFPAYTGRYKTSVELYSITGGLIKQATGNRQQGTENKFQLNIADLAKGVYILTIRNYELGIRNKLIIKD